MLESPETEVIANGGEIFFAIDGEAPIGTVAAIRQSADVFELAKMAVQPSHRGRGVAEALGRAAIAYAREQGAALMYLETNDTLKNAIRLYDRLGFVHAIPPRVSPYARSNVYMEIRLRA